MERMGLERAGMERMGMERMGLERMGLEPGRWRHRSGDRANYPKSWDRNWASFSLDGDGTREPDEVMVRLRVPVVEYCNGAATGG